LIIEQEKAPLLRRVATFKAFDIKECMRRREIEIKSQSRKVFSTHHAICEYATDETTFCPQAACESQAVSWTLLMQSINQDWLVWEVKTIAYFMFYCPSTSLMQKTIEKLYVN
jgi:hypothetical protein